jgi:hypothetical protein
MVIAMLPCILIFGPSKIAQTQTNSAWRWGIWDTTEPGAQQRGTPQAAAQEINGRGWLVLSECAKAWLSFVYRPDFVVEMPQAPIAPIRLLVLRWRNSKEGASGEIRPDGLHFDVDAMSRDGRFRSLLNADSFAICLSKDWEGKDLAECAQFSAENFREAVSFVCERR